MLNGSFQSLGEKLGIGNWLRLGEGMDLRPEVRFVGSDGWSRMLDIEIRMEVGA